MDAQQTDPTVDQKPEQEQAPEDEEKRPPVYHVEAQTGHYGACYKLVNEKKGADANVYTGVWSNIHNGLAEPYRSVLATYWMAALRDIEVGDHNYKEHQLPLARIKKVMKADPEVKMISAEAPILFAKGCDIFITELTMRAWIHAEENKRRTLQRSDIAAALTKSDMYDFLIDIVPREEATASATKRSANQGQANAAAQQAQSMPPQQAQTMVPPQPHASVPPVYEHDQYHPQEHDPYRQQAMYGQPPQAYGHYPAPQMPVDPNTGMYYGGMQPQMYMQQQQPQQMVAPPRQDHPGAPPGHHYQHYDVRQQQQGDAEGETEDV